MKDFISRIFKNNFPELYNQLLHLKQGRYSYTFFKDKYPDSFLNNTCNPTNLNLKAPEVIYCFWTGDNEMSENRKRGLKSLEEKSGLPVKLITPKNLNDYILQEAPLHKGYELLSLVHRADYLRCYFMHHYGGGYADVKTFHHSWKNAFKKLNRDKNKMVIGYPEVGGIAQVGGKLYKDMQFHMSLLIGNGAYICKPYTPFTTEWHKELHNRMDEYYEPLIAFKTNGGGYPIPYTYILGQIFHPLALKYHKKILKDKNLMPDFKNYK